MTMSTYVYIYIISYFHKSCAAHRLVTTQFHGRVVGFTLRFPVDSSYQTVVKLFDRNTSLATIGACNYFPTPKHTAASSKNRAASFVKTLPKAAKAAEWIRCEMIRRHSK